VQTVRLAPSAARLRGICAGSAPGAPGHTSHNPPVVGSSPTRPTYLTCGNVRFGPAGQHAYRMDAGVVAAMTPAERFAERRKRRQKPLLAKLELVRPGPVARHSSLTRYPGPKPPPFARRGADGHGRRRVRGIPQPERLSTRHLRGAAPTADARPHATARQAPIPPPALHHKPCGSRAGTGHNLTKRGCVFPPPRRRLASDGAIVAELPEVIGLLHWADWTRLSLSAEVRSSPAARRC
jgi:hypothetical protein